MKVLIYGYHHRLPFWHTPANPEFVYTPEMIEGWKTKNSQRPAEEYQMVPVMNGLHKLEIEGLVAHVSVILDPVNKEITDAHRCWVQISTEPKEVDEKSGLPVVVKDGKVQVKEVWAQIDGDGSWSLLRGEPGPTTDKDEFWRIFFLQKLQKSRRYKIQVLMEEIARAQQKLSMWQGFKIPEVNIFFPE